MNKNAERVKMSLIDIFFVYLRRPLKKGERLCQLKKKLKRLKRLPK